MQNYTFNKSPGGKNGPLTGSAAAQYLKDMKKQQNKIAAVIITLAAVFGVSNNASAQKHCEFFIRDSAEFISRGETIVTKMNGEKTYTQTKAGEKYCLYEERVAKCRGLYGVVRGGVDKSGEKFGGRVGAGIGYEWHCGLRVEAEFSYFRLQEKMKGQVTEIEEEYSPSVTGNVYWDFSKHRKVNFFIFGGYGQTQTHWHLAVENEDVSVKAQNQGGTGTLVYGAGLSFKTGLATALELSFRGTHVSSKDRTAEVFGVTLGFKFKGSKKSSWLR